MFLRCLAVAIVVVSPSMSAHADWSMKACWRDYWARRGEPAVENPLLDSSIPLRQAREWGQQRRKDASIAAAATTAAATTAAVSTDARIAKVKSKPDRWHRWATNRRMPRYGLDPIPTLDESRPLVVFVHGLNSRPEDLVHLVWHAKQFGLACLTFRYPNDQAIDRSADLLSQELRRLGAQFTGPVYLVTHSMGGLVARAALENRTRDPGNVRRLVMIAPPNHGSNLAKYIRSLDVYEYVTSASRRSESGLIAGSLSDGRSQAVRDLRPGSRFLRQLNGRNRNAQVKYSIVLGTGGPLQGTELVWVERFLDTTEDRCRWMSCAKRGYERHFESNAEVFSGQGDGLVSIRSGQLEGVDDVVIGGFQHADLLGGTGDPEIERVRGLVFARLGP